MKSVLLLFSFLASVPAFPCSTFYFSAAGYPYVVKNMDWHSGQGLLYVNKRHVRKKAIFMAKNPLVWTSRYVSLALSETGRDFPWDGMNEAGLSVMALALQETMIPPDTDSRPTVDNVQWLQYILDTSATLTEAIDNAEKVRVGDRSTVHYFLCDAVGDCAVLEYLRGSLVIHRGRDLPYAALANNNYAASLAYLDKALGAMTPMKILDKVSNDSLDRFSRASIWSRSFPVNGDPLYFSYNALSNLVESGVPWPTQWRMVFNLKEQVAYLGTAIAPRIKSVRLPAFDPGCASGAKILNLNAAIVGDATQYFVPYTAEANKTLATGNQDLSPQVKARIGVYPETYTRCLE